MAPSLARIVGTIRRQGYDALSPRFGIDVRALAAFRIALGTLVVADLLFRVRDLRVFYTDAGVLPREALAEFSPILARFSIHAWTGSAAGQAVLFVLAGCLAVALVVGYRTRVATLAVAVLHASLYARNTYLMNGGDGLLVLALFLGVFLPLGERWSVDSLRRRGSPGDETTDPTDPTERPSWVASMATATLLSQLVVVYLANVAFKLRSDLWRSGDAVRYVLELEQFSILLGPHLTAYPDLLVAVNWLWMAMLVASPLLVFTTGRLRTLVAAGFVVAHLGMLATMRLGLFPLVVVALLLVYLPPSVWEGIDRHVATGTGPLSRLSATFDRLPRDVLEGEPREFRQYLPRPVLRGARVTIPVVLAVVLAASVLWPVAATGVVDTSSHDVVPEVDGYSWTLFAPNPPTSTRWFVAPATLDSGERIDAIDGSAVEWDPPPDAAATYPSTLWHRYLGDMRWTSDAEREYLAAYLCRRAAADSGTGVTNVSVYAVEQPVEAAGGGEPGRTELVAHDCSTDP